MALLEILDVTAPSAHGNAAAGIESSGPGSTAPWTNPLAWSRLAQLNPCQPFGFYLQSPRRGGRYDQYTLPIRGWAYCRESPVRALAVGWREGPVQQVKAQSASKLPETVKRLLGAEISRFQGSAVLLGLPLEDEVSLTAILENGHGIPLGTLRFRRAPLRSEFQPRLQPLMVTTLGRTGSTWLMRALGTHPAILLHDHHPYETRAGQFWLQQLNFLSRADQAAQGLGGEVPPHLGWLKDDPRARSLRHLAAARDWFNRGHLEELARHCLSSVETFYQHVAADQRSTGAAYFAEKQFPDSTAWLTQEMYAEPREIFLVRDFRDMFCSMRAFNAKRGYTSFCRDQVASDEEHIQVLAKQAERLLSHWRRRAEKSLLIRYEDLVSQPETTLKSVFAYVGVEATPLLVRQVLKKAAQDNTTSRFHRTSQSVEESIGRWQHQLDAPLRAACQNAFGSLLHEFGYRTEAMPQCA